MKKSETYTPAETSERYNDRMERQGLKQLKRWVHVSRYDELAEQSKKWRKPKNGS